MSVQKIKSDLNGVCNTVSRVITECERLKTVVSSLGIVKESDLQRMIASADNLKQVVTTFERDVNTVHNECSIELVIFFKTYNQLTRKFVTECREIIAQLDKLKEDCNACFEFYRISDEIEWILMCEITPELFNWIVRPLYSFKNELQMLQLKTYENNNKLIVKVR